MGPDRPLVLVVVRPGGEAALLLDNYECIDQVSAATLPAQLTVIASAKQSAPLARGSARPGDSFLLSGPLGTLAFEKLDEESISPSFVEAWLEGLNAEQ